MAFLLLLSSEYDFKLFRSLNLVQSLKQFYNQLECFNLL